MTKLTGAEWKRFYKDPEFWPEQAGLYHDDVLIHLNGEPSSRMTEDPDSILDTNVLEIECGEVYNRCGSWINSLDDYFEAWRTKTTKKVFSVECDVADADAVNAAIIAAGGRIL